ncbi:MAG: hypothetical protein AAGH88_05210 [Planctomycetota bacterium]
MSSISPLLARTSTAMSSDLLQRRLQDTQRELLRAQDQASTGKAVGRGSDDPGSISAILTLNQLKLERNQQLINLDHASGVLNIADAALGDITNILIESQQIASSQIGVGSDATTRQTQAEVIDAQLRGVIEIANRDYNNLAIFGGNNGPGNDGLLFEEFLGGIRYTGSTENLYNDVGAVSDEFFTTNGLDALGALSSRVASLSDLDPQASGGVRLVDIDGARGEGFAAGSINLTVNGTPVVVDLGTAETLGDITTRINDAITTTSPGAGSVGLGPSGYTVTANAGNTITIADPQGGTTAADLGIVGTTTSGSTAGSGLNVRLTGQTLLADLGATLDWASGLSITPGENTKVADFSSATTVQDVQNVIQSLGLGLRMTINDDGTALDMVSEVSGISLSVGENGGTTAEDLGLRTLGQTTALADFRNGIGVEMTAAGEPDVSISLHDGTSFTVDLASATTVSEVIALIEAEAAVNGLTVGVDFDVDLAATGNGITLTDNTVGANDFVVADAGLSHAAEHLGIKQNAGTGTAITGTDNSQVRVENLFTHLLDLRNSLRSNDELGITLAGGNIEQDIDSAVSARARVGVQARRIDDQRTLVQDKDLQEQTMLSELQDADLTEVLTRISQLQLQLQASLQVGSSNLQLSLLDFLR